MRILQPTTYAERLFSTLVYTTTKINNSREFFKSNRYDNFIATLSCNSKIKNYAELRRQSQGEVFMEREIKCRLTLVTLTLRPSCMLITFLHFCQNNNERSNEVFKAAL